MFSHIIPAGVIRYGINPYGAGHGTTLAGEHLDQLTLAVTGDAGNANDFIRADKKIELIYRRFAAIAVNA